MWNASVVMILLIVLLSFVIFQHFLPLILMSLLINQGHKYSFNYFVINLGAKTQGCNIIF